MSDSLRNPVYGTVNVPLAILWLEPKAEYQNISRKAAADATVWAEGLDSDQRLGLVGSVETMALWGERVVILDAQDAWLKVAALSQRTKKNSSGYPGWVLAGHVSEHPVYLQEQLALPAAVVMKPQVSLWADSALTKVRGLLSYQTRFPVMAESDTFFQVRLPDGSSGFLSPAGTQKSTGLFFDGEKIVQEARQFLGLKYLWGGTSGSGFDCSGLMFRLYQSQGVSIPRDASEQAGEGIAVSKDELRPGDLLFFAHEHHPEKIHHVGLFIGEGLMIHAPNSRSAIRIEPFEDGVYGAEYWGAKRYAK